MTAIALSSRTRRWRAVLMLVSALLGAAFSFTLVTLLGHIGLNIKSLSSMDLIGFILAASFLAVGLLITAISLSAQQAGRQLEQSPDAPPASKRELNLFRMQGGVLALAGLLLGAPQIAVMSGASSQSRTLVFAGIVLAFLLQSGLNWLIWLRSDEFVRALIMQTSVISFWVAQGALFLAAAAEKLGLTPGFSLWNACICLLTFYFVSSVVLAARSARR